MQRFLHCGITLCACVSLASCSTTSESKMASSHEFTGGLWSLTLSSTAFNNAKPIPKLFTADGSDFSPPLTWTKAPEPAQQYVLIVEDPDAGKEPFVLWLVYDIPVSVTSLPQAISPPGSAGGGAVLRGTEGKNSNGKIGYAGPRPPSGKPHRYFIQLIAIDKALGLPAGADKQAVMNAIEDHVITKGVLMGTYQR